MTPRPAADRGNHRSVGIGLARRRRARRGWDARAVVAAGLAMATLAGCTLLPVPFLARSGSPSPSTAASASPVPSSPADPSPTPRATQGTKHTHQARAQRQRLRGYIRHGPRTKRWIALTFDEDMRPSMYAVRDSVRWYDPRIIRLLERTRTPATIFLNGLFAKAYPDVLRRLARNPRIELGNHSWDHQGWTADCGPNDRLIRPPMTKRKEVVWTDRIVKRLTGVRMRYFRFPAGCHSNADVRFVWSLGEASIGWDCYFGDALDFSASQQVRNVQRTCGRGSIVVTHLDGPPYHYDVYEALKRLIPWWKKHGWRVVTVGTLLGHPTKRPG
jgi:peptidoglycan/xylan/chitin deacetylase (PgdA/CDA1 family)